MMLLKILCLMLFGLSLEGNFAAEEFQVNAHLIQSNDDLGHLFLRIQEKPRDPHFRGEMAVLSKRLGYQSVSEFFQATTEYLQGKKVLRSKSRKTSWFCTESPEEVQASLVFSREMALLIRKEQNAAAIEKAEARLKANGFSCHTMVEWSRAVLATANQQQGGISTKLNEELAVRWLLTAAEEINLYPFGLEGKATIYNFLSDYFLLKRDYVSAYVSVLLAIEHLRSGGVSLVDENRLNEKLRFLGSVREK